MPPPKPKIGADLQKPPTPRPAPQPTEDASSRLSRDRRLNWERSHLGTRAILKPCSVQHSLLGGRLLVSLTGVFPFTVWLPWGRRVASAARNTASKLHVFLNASVPNLDAGHEKGD
ncbi:hypothetical protein NDU88_005640 [Pleurodeles waltl]|uniref:Uncharacterized protein n=1 Tax=Pleurodeles waltl TaxID=8319 RepID=A0AAV7SMH5_PLEWA|nr:hypothetical protein NDU88_005640 [Pleurodeles waltl]